MAVQASQCQGWVVTGVAGAVDVVAARGARVG